VELISNKVPDGGACSVYRCGPLIDLCKGPHVPDTGRIKAFEVLEPLLYSRKYNERYRYRYKNKYRYKSTYMYNYWYWQRS
jgi:threonyl-tRNA synthetase